MASRKKAKISNEDYIRVRYKEENLPGSYGGAQRLKSILKKDVHKALRAEPSYTLHVPVRYKFRRRKVIVGAPHDQWQADLVDVSAYRGDNRGVKYLLCVIDVFSKYAWVKTLKNKSALTVKQSLEKIINEAATPPLFLQTDKGMEFRGDHVQRMLKKKGINFFTSENDDIKACIVERFQLTLQRKMHRMFTAKRTHKFLRALPSLVTSYNSTYHSSIGMSPKQALNTDNIEKIWHRLYERDGNNTDARPVFAIGDSVRISKARRVFKKGYLPQWTEEIFTICSVLNHTTPITYKLEDSAGQPLEGSFYKQELQKVTPPDYYDIEEIIDTRKRKGQTEYLIKWRGYPTSFNTWQRDIIRLH